MGAAESLIRVSVGIEDEGRPDRQTEASRTLRLNEERAGMSRLADKIAVITGGQGRSRWQLREAKFVDEGARVCLADLDGDALFARGRTCSATPP